MATYSKLPLYYAGNKNAPIKVTGTTSDSLSVHKTESANTSMDEIWLYAYNSSSASVLLTIQFGGTASPDNDIKVSIPSQSGLTLVVPGLILKGDGQASAYVYAYASVANVITLSGYVNRIS